MNQNIVHYTLAILSGILLLLGMPSFDYAFFAWIGFIPLLYALEKQTTFHRYFLINVTCMIWSIGTHMVSVRLRFMGVRINLHEWSVLRGTLSNGV